MLSYLVGETDFYLNFMYKIQISSPVITFRVSINQRRSRSILTISKYRRFNGKVGNDQSHENCHNETYNNFRISFQELNKIFAKRSTNRSWTCTVSTRFIESYVVRAFTVRTTGWRSKGWRIVGGWRWTSIVDEASANNSGDRSIHAGQLRKRE